MCGRGRPRLRGSAGSFNSKLAGWNTLFERHHVAGRQSYPTTAAVGTAKQPTVLRSIRVYEPQCS